MEDGNRKSNLTFDLVAGIYSLFYNSQKKKYGFAADAAKPFFDISEHETVLDVGCGTGALCSVLREKGLAVTGVDNSIKMLRIAALKNSRSDVVFIHHDVISGLPFSDKSFDFSIASYVAHGMAKSERYKLLREMKRVSKRFVILHEFGKKRKPATDIIEWLEGGHYFEFIRSIENELDEIFASYRKIAVGKNAYWYICGV